MKAFGEFLKHFFFLFESFLAYTEFGLKLHDMLYLLLLLLKLLCQFKWLTTVVILLLFNSARTKQQNSVGSGRGLAPILGLGFTLPSSKQNIIKQNNINMTDPNNIATCSEIDATG